MQQQFFLLVDSEKEDRDTTLLNQHSATVFLAYLYLLSMHFQCWQAHFSSLCWMISIFENEHVRYTFFVPGLICQEMRSFNAIKVMTETDGKWSYQRIVTVFFLVFAWLYTELHYLEVWEL